MPIFIKFTQINIDKRRTVSFYTEDNETFIYQYKEQCIKHQPCRKIAHINILQLFLQGVKSLLQISYESSLTSDETDSCPRFNTENIK